MRGIAEKIIIIITSHVFRLEVLHFNSLGGCLRETAEEVEVKKDAPDWRPGHPQRLPESQRWRRASSVCQVAEVLQDTEHALDMLMTHQ